MKTKTRKKTVWRPLLFYQTKTLYQHLFSMSRKPSLQCPRIHHQRHGSKSWIDKLSCALFRMASYPCTHHHMIRSYPYSCTMQNKILPRLKCIFPSNLMVDLVPVRFHLPAIKLPITKSIYRYHRNRSHVHHLRIFLHVHSPITCRYPQPIFSRAARLPLLVQHCDSAHLPRYSFYNPSPQARKLHRA